MKQLYETAIDPNLPLEYRYEALKKLIERANEMKKLTTNQVAVYEILKNGECGSMKITTKLGIPHKSASRSLVHLVENGYAKRHGMRGKYTYTAIDKPYVEKVYTRRLSGEKVMPVRKKNIGYGYEFTEEQAAMIRKFKDRQFTFDGQLIVDRTPFSKITGIPKLHLNFELERIG